MTPHPGELRVGRRCHNQKPPDPLGLSAVFKGVGIGPTTTPHAISDLIQLDSYRGSTTEKQRG